jgi:hypothetical protein
MKPAAVAAILAVLAAPAFAQQKRDDPLKESAYGHRVEIMLTSGFGLLGKIIQSPYQGDETDLSKARQLFLDMSLEYPEMGGRRDPISGKIEPNLFGFDRKMVKSVRRLPDLTAEEVAQREKLREEALARLLVEEANRRKAEAEAEAARRKETEDATRKKRAEDAKTTEGQLRQAAERLEKGREAYEKYPPSEWGPERLKAIQQKNITRVPMSVEEKGFIDSLDDWMYYDTYLKNKDLPKPPPTGETKEPPKESPKQ